MGEGQKITLIFISVIFLGQLCWTQEKSTYLNHYTSKYRLLCYDGCRLHNNDYYGCNTKKGWDYCSINPNTDYKGFKCRDDHPCDLYDENYYWCYNKVGENNYCGKVEPRTVLYRSAIYQSECRDECSYDESRYYYWCYTDKGWDYCSTAKDVTYRNEPCRSDHWCETHGYYYSWCRTASSWDYCGLVKTSKVNETNGHPKTQPNNTVEICTQIDLGNRRVTTITAEMNPEAMADGSNWKNEITDIITQWDNSSLCNQTTSNLNTTVKLHTDIQGLKEKNNQNYYNLQIQVDMHRPKGMSNIVAQVLIPQNEDIPDRYVHRAFNESFVRRARVFVDVSYGNITVSHGQNCD